MRRQSFITILGAALFVVVAAAKIEAQAVGAEDLVTIAKRKFKELTNAEEKLLQSISSGDTADFSSGTEKENDPAKAEAWGKERVLKADRIAWLCTTPQASTLVTHRGIVIKGALIDKDLDLAFAKIPFPLVLEKCAILKKSTAK